MRACVRPSVRRSVRPSVRPSVGPSVMRASITQSLLSLARSPRLASPCLALPRLASPCLALPRLAPLALECAPLRACKCMSKKNLRRCTRLQSTLVMWQSDSTVSVCSCKYAPLKRLQTLSAHLLACFSPLSPESPSLPTLPSCRRPFSLVVRKHHCRGYPALPTSYHFRGYP